MLCSTESNPDPCDNPCGVLEESVALTSESLQVVVRVVASPLSALVTCAGHVMSRTCETCGTSLTRASNWPRPGVGLEYRRAASVALRRWPVRAGSVFPAPFPSERSASLRLALGLSDAVAQAGIEVLKLGPIFWAPKSKPKHYTYRRCGVYFGFSVPEIGPRNEDLVFRCPGGPSSRPKGGLPREYQKLGLALSLVWPGRGPSQCRFVARAMDPANPDWLGAGTPALMRNGFCRQPGRVGEPRLPT